ncbi:ABC transporter substrate-binding protein [Labedella endophytica]|uniref:Carbohydrate ABC transporter substrate-binding protein n=1 Tax=Labedella endophytica TaxID=1523160 RepID=A0A3S1CRZ2_9MICO|nr:ABC transporter substrate-binding protein [Labedella endophytica]RUR00926.1 carbohydrate ABC transporter substrate-binding protein [Labedella endophytica]
MSKSTLQDVSRRNFLTYAGVGAITVGAFALAGCSIGGGSGGTGTTTVRFAWWGGADRQKAYLAGLDSFGQQNENITVEPEFGDYNAFQERMTTQMAARDVPEVFWIPSPAVLTYRDASIYRDLEGIETLDLSAFSAAEIDSFRLDGVLDTLPKSMFSPVLRYNSTFMEEDGVTLPEDLTWEALSEFLIDYTKDNANGRKGTTYGPYHDMPFESFVRQHGEDLWTKDGKLGASVDTVAEWIDWWETLRKAGATTTVSEQDGIEASWSLTGNKVLATFANSNHIVDEALAFPDYTFDQRDIPAFADAAAGYHFVYYSRFAMYARAEDDRVDAAGELMSFNLNSLELLKLVGLSAGAPPNTSLLDEYEPEATEVEKKVIAITREIAATERRDRFEAPAGSGNWRTMFVRELEAVTLGDRSVSDAASNFVDAVTAEIETA